MARQVVTEQELLHTLNQRLALRDQCSGCQFTSVVRLQGQAHDGRNWTTANLRCSGTPASVCAPAANAVVEEVSKSHNLV